MSNMFKAPGSSAAAAANTANLATQRTAAQQNAALFGRQSDLYSQWQNAQNKISPQTDLMGNWLQGNDQPSWMNVGTAPTLQSVDPTQAYNQTLNSYNTLGRGNIESQYGGMINSANRNLMGRGLFMPNTGASNTMLGVERWRDVAGAKLGAEGQQAALQALINAYAAQNQTAQQGFQNEAVLRSERGTDFWNVLNSLLGQNQTLLSGAQGVNVNNVPAVQVQQVPSLFQQIAQLAAGAYGSGATGGSSTPATGNAANYVGYNPRYIPSNSGQWAF